MERILPDARQEDGIFPMTKEDLSQVVFIEQASFSVPWSQNAFESTLRCPTTMPLVYRKDGKILGYAVCSTVYEMAELYNLAVDQSSRGTGIGAELLAFVIRYCQKKGAENLFLEVRRSNDPARRLYERFGFTYDSVRKNYYKNPTEDALLMHLPLKQ